MKRKYISIILFFTTFIFGSHALAVALKDGDSGNVGTINISGEITVPDCKIEMGEANFDFGENPAATVPYHTYKTSDNNNNMKDETNEAYTKKFTINASDCVVIGGKSLKIKFTGLRAVKSNYPALSSVAGTDVVMPFVSDPSDNDTSDVGVYLFAHSKNENNERRQLNFTESFDHFLFLNKDNTGSMTVEVELVSLNKAPYYLNKAGKIKIPVGINYIVR